MQQQRPNQLNQAMPNAQPPIQNTGNTNHGGHELFDAHEVIAGIINLLDHYQMYEQHVQDPELKTILNHQSQFVTTMYNTIVQSFQTGQDPKVPTGQYTMQQSNEVVYGINPGPPKKPNQSVNELSDKGLTAYMLGHTKSLASLFTMTALEMTNPILRRVVSDSVPNLIELSYEIFLYQNKHSYYQVPQLTQQDMQLMLQSYATVPSQGTIH